MRTKSPRADRLDKIRDIAIIVHKNGGHFSKKDLIREITSKVTPPQLNQWSKSNIREYIGALEFLKLASSEKRTIYLTTSGKTLATAGSLGLPLNEQEKEILRQVIFQNQRFQLFLALFMNGKVPKDLSEFIRMGKSISLKRSELKTDLDRREVQDIFKSWALSTEIIEWDVTKNLFFPVGKQDILLDEMFKSIKEVYNKIENKIIKRAEIYKIKDIICQKYRIPRNQFYNSLIEISKNYSEIRLEVIPITMIPMQKLRIEAIEHFGIVTKKGIYYYIKLLNSGGY
jgi:hypothetical protein